MGQGRFFRKLASYYPWARSAVLIRTAEAGLFSMSSIESPALDHSNFAYKWWPCGQKALNRYLEFRPAYNYFSLEEWGHRLSQGGLRIVDYQYYLSRKAARLFLFLDYHFSHVYITSDRTVARPVIRGMRKTPLKVWARLWTTMFAKIRIPCQDAGDGILITKAGMIWLPICTIT